MSLFYQLPEIGEFGPAEFTFRKVFGQNSFHFRAQPVPENLIAYKVQKDIGAVLHFMRNHGMAPVLPGVSTALSQIT